MKELNNGVVSLYYIGSLILKCKSFRPLVVSEQESLKIDFLTLYMNKKSLVMSNIGQYFLLLYT